MADGSDVVTATIPVGDSLVWVAVNPAGTDAYVTSNGIGYASGWVSVIDLATNTVTNTIDVPGYADAVAVNPAGTDAYVTSNGLGSGPGWVSVIDLATNTVTDSIDVPGYPEAVAVNPAGTDAYVTNDADDTVSVIDLATNTVTTTIGVTGDAVAVNPAGTDAYVTNTNGLSVIDLATNTVTATIGVSGYPVAVAVNPAGTDAYVTNDSPSDGSGTVSVIDLATDTVTATIGVGQQPRGIAVSPGGTDAYVANYTGGCCPGPPVSGTVSVIDLATDTVTATIGVGVWPNGVAVNPAGTDAYVANEGDTVSVINLAADIVPPASPPPPTAIGGDHRATVTVTPPAIGDTPTSYTVTARDATTPGHGGQTCTVTGPAGSCTLTGLTNGDTYTATATATDTAGTSAPSPASNPVAPVAPADIALTLTGPAHAADSSVFTENVTVSDHSPASAFGVATNLFVPAGLTVTAAPGATLTSGTLDWIDPTLAAGASTTHAVTFTVGATTHGTATIGGVAKGDGPDPDPTNNAAITTIHLG